MARPAAFSIHQCCQPALMINHQAGHALRLNHPTPSACSPFSNAGCKLQPLSPCHPRLGPLIRFVKPTVLVRLSLQPTGLLSTLSVASVADFAKPSSPTALDVAFTVGHDCIPGRPNSAARAEVAETLVPPRAGGPVLRRVTPPPRGPAQLGG